MKCTRRYLGPVAAMCLAAGMMAAMPDGASGQMQGVVLVGRQVVNIDIGPGINDDGPVPVQRRLSDAQSNSMVRSALQAPKTGDPLAWLDAAEDKLVAVGDQGLLAMHTELARATGPDADVLEAAIFRIEHPGVDVHGAITAWAVKHLGMEKSEVDPATLIKLRHVPGVPAIFPHHIFYAVGQTGKPDVTVVALAEDGKVQPLTDDAALLKFLQQEADYDPAAAAGKARESLATAAALLALARGPAPKTFVTAESHSIENTVTPAGKGEIKLTADDTQLNVTATVTFDDHGKLAAVATESEASTRPVAPISPDLQPPGRGRRGGRGPTTAPAPPQPEVMPVEK